MREPFLRFWDQLSYPMWTGFADTVLTGRGQAATQLSEREQRLYSEGVEAIQAAPAHALPAVYDFGRYERLLDLGGGTGSWLLAPGGPPAVPPPAHDAVRAPRGSRARPAATGR